MAGGSFFLFFFHQIDNFIVLFVDINDLNVDLYFSLAKI